MKDLSKRRRTEWKVKHLRHLNGIGKDGKQQKNWNQLANLQTVIGNKKWDGMKRK